MKASELIDLGNGLEIHFCLDAGDTNAQFTLFKVVIHPNAKVPAAHFHENFDETLYGLKGSLTLRVDDQLLQLNPGDHFFIKRGRIHSFINETTETVEILAFANPGVFTADYFKDILELMKAGAPPDRERLKNVMLQYGLVPVAS
ncbi:cupin domain-containing protein [Niabella yanshanensis]|uniref:Cupin domain-containing protein n=1 Tax=Niabella yanshanensis TaxID=577386 RepID=A0ABZ0W5N6_9BACT|nr:cupin domain-containing protein [Niabella yanshanensis]WQD38244.1 cupin domain-containing protein [Niabella yanshanensis]